MVATKTASQPRPSSRNTDASSFLVPRSEFFVAQRDTEHPKLETKNQELTTKN